MGDSLRLGTGRFMVPITSFIWHRLIRAAAGDARKSLRFMTDDHHRVRDFAVLELAHTGTPLSPSTIAARLDLDIDRVDKILTDLEKRMLFLYRSRGTDVTWAYPITVDETPHRATFSTGEQAYSP
jgi:hypothetical protein